MASLTLTFTSTRDGSYRLLAESALTGEASGAFASPFDPATLRALQKLGYAEVDEGVDGG